MWSLKLYREFEKNIKREQDNTVNEYSIKHTTIPSDVISFFIRVCAARLLTPLGSQDPKTSIKNIITVLKLGEITGRENTGYTEDFFLVLRYGDDDSVKKLVEERNRGLSQELEDQDVMKEVREFLNALIDDHVKLILNEYLQRLERLSQDKQRQAPAGEGRGQHDRPYLTGPGTNGKKPRK